MKFFTLCLCLFAFSTIALAQQTKRIRIEDNQDVQEAMNNQVYRYPEFRTGRVYLPNDYFNTVKLNLNLLLDQFQFIDDKKDTLTILTPESLAYIKIDTSRFIYYDKGFLEIIGEYAPVMLAVNRKMKIADLQREGAYGSKTSTASIANISTGFTDMLRYNPKVYEDLLINTVQTYYLLDDNNNINLLNKRNILQAFSAHKDKVNEYIKQHKVNFKNEKEVRALLAYASTL
ncbi:MAG: hypothetical protein KY428_02650 [Bacteroidetes bacterium]|nr:hypothetical protein [Bacteroidota bacterium]